MQHSFDIDIAKEYGILEAVILNLLEIWLADAEVGKRDIHFGRHWVRMDIKGFCELMPYATEDEIKDALKHLLSENIILMGKPAPVIDRDELWHTLTDRGKELVRWQL